MDEKLTVALSFGQFSDLSQEEYGKILNLFSKPVPKSTVQFPWDEVEYFSQGEGASIRRSDESESDGENSPGPGQLQSKVLAQTKAAVCVPKHTLPAVEFVIRGKSSKTCNEGSAATAGSTSSSGAAKPRRNKKRRDPNYYQKYSSDLPAGGHHNHINSEEPGMAVAVADSQTLVTAAAPPVMAPPVMAPPAAAAATAGPPAKATPSAAVAQPAQPSLPTIPPAATTTATATVTPTTTTGATAASTAAVADGRTIGHDQAPLAAPSQPQQQATVNSASSEQSSGASDSTSQPAAAPTPPTNGGAASQTKATASQTKATASQTKATASQTKATAASPVNDQAAVDQAKAGGGSKVSWAGLFHNTDTAKSSQVVYVAPPEPQPAPAENSAASPGNEDSSASGPATLTTTTANSTCFEEDFKIEQVPVDKDQCAKRLGSAIIDLELNHRPVALHPRGLINTSNWCYINSILQVLVACPPFYNYLRSLPKFSSYPNRSPTSMPMLDRLIRFVNEFDIMHSNKQQLQPGKRPELIPGPPFEPGYIYQLVSVGKTCLSSKGRQEDAEEFLGCLLNGLHEEMLVCMTAASTEQPEVDGVADLDGEAQADQLEGQDDQDQDGWQEVQKGKKNKSSITRGSNFEKSPISEIFGGQIRSVLQQPGSKESATLQPFFTLQLDIQSEKIWSVKDALQHLTTKETLHDYTKGEGEGEAWRRIFLERLPYVLILHLKRFVYDKSGGCQKLIKKIECNIDIDISKELLSANMKSKVNQGQRSYKLFAILYHHGNKASGGHYTTDIFHVGINGWVRLDDQNVKVVRQSEVLKGSTDTPAGPGSKGQNPVPYLLCYRRCDLLNNGTPLTRILGQQLQQQQQQQQQHHHNNFRPLARQAAADP